MSTPTRSKIIMAIDPGFDRLGLAVMKSVGGEPEILFSECLKTDPKKPRSERLFFIGERLRILIKKWKPESLALETLFFNTNTTSAIGVAEARGVVLYEAERAGVKVFEYGPQRVKIAVTGYGKADKTQMAEMVKRLVRLSPKPQKRLDDEMDAIALGITHLATQKGI